MAQYIWDANKYPNGTLLSAFGEWISSNSPAMSFQVNEIGATGRKYWKQIAGTGTNQIIYQQLLGDYELMLLADFTGDEISGATTHGLGLSLKTWSLNETTNYFTSYSARVAVPGDTLTYQSVSTTYLNSTKDVAPTGLLSEKALGLRMQLVGGSALKARIWAADVGGLEAAEPTAWNFEGSYKVTENSAPALANINGATRFSAISLGTNGDPAPFQIVGQSVTTPSNPVVSNIQATSASLDWT